MKKMFASLAVLSVLLIPAQGAFAWTYNGLASLNPFTGFRNCNKCVKVKTHKCHKVKKCDKCAKIIRTQKRCAKAFDY